MRILEALEDLRERLANGEYDEVELFPVSSVISCDYDLPYGTACAVVLELWLDGLLTYDQFVDSIAEREFLEVMAEDDEPTTLRLGASLGNRT